MTREEAILKIEYIRDGNDFTPTDAQVKAMNMAIEALQTKDKPFKAVAEVKVDTDEIVKRIKEEYVFADEVVRCKDCKWWYYGEDCVRHTEDTLGYAISTTKNDYCSFGERR